MAESTVQHAAHVAAWYAAKGDARRAEYWRRASGPERTVARRLAIFGTGDSASARG